MFRFALPVIASALALAGCGTRDNEGANAGANISGRTENGQLTARVQGVDLKVNLPPPIRRMAESDDFLPPRARTVRGPGQRFHSSDDIGTVAAWYTDPARRNRFAIRDEIRNDGVFVLTGTARGGDSFTVRLTPGASGGTDGTVDVTPRR
jgi:hypothetical protein